MRALTALVAALVALVSTGAQAQPVPPDGKVVMPIHRDGLDYDARGEARQALSMFGQACDMGLAASCTMAGRVEHDLATSQKDHMRAAHMFAKACRMGDDLGCAGTGLALGPLSRASSDAPRGLMTLALLRMGEECRHEGGARACADAADLLGGDGELGPNLPVIRAYVARACKEQAFDGCISLAMLPAEPRDAETARKWNEDTCLAGRATGCDAMLDALLADGAGRDGNVAALTKACDAWVGIACADLGLYFSQGPEEYRHPAVARRFIRNGCDAYVAKACFAYGVMHKKGIGGAVNEKRALSLVGHACELGERKACMTLARIARSSDAGTAAGFTPDRARAHACRLGERQACNGGES